MIYWITFWIISNFDSFLSGDILGTSCFNLFNNILISSCLAAFFSRQDNFFSFFKHFTSFISLVDFGDDDDDGDDADAVVDVDDVAVNDVVDVTVVLGDDEDDDEIWDGEMDFDEVFGFTMALNYI